MRAGSNWRHLNGLSLGMMGDPVRCLPKVVHPDVAALKLQHNRILNHPLHMLVDVGVFGFVANLWLLGAFLVPPAAGAPRAHRSEGRRGGPRYGRNRMHRGRGRGLLRVDLDR